MDGDSNTTTLQSQGEAAAPVFPFSRFVVRLGGLVDRFKVLISGREQDFLDLGAGLQEVWIQSGGFAELASELAEKASGREMEEVVKKMGSEMDELTGMCSIDEGEESLGELGMVRDTVSGLGDFLDQFKRIVRSLQMLGISTRIESARLGSLGSGFSTLSDDVEKLAGKIVDHSGRIMEKGKELGNLVDTAIQGTSSIIHAQRACSVSILQNVRANLDTLSRMGENSRRVAQELPARTRGISENMGEVVASVQFHDIVRQQVEHVEHALEDIRAEFATREDAPLERETRNLVGWAADVTKLQVSQTENARDSIETAVERLKEHMLGIASSVRSIRSEVNEVVRAGDGQESDVLDGVEKSVSGVMATIGDFSRQGEEMGSIMQNVADTVSEMSGFVVDIEEVGSEIELIALNASIKAAHTGGEGAALGVLAVAIQSLSVQAREVTDALSGALRNISEASLILQKNAESYTDTSQVREMLSSMEELTGLLRSLSGEVRGLLGRVAREGESLAGSVEATADSVVFHLELSTAMHELAAEVDELAGEAREAAPKADTEGMPDRLREMLERYTMEAERDVHLEILENVPAAGAGGDEGEIELFGDDGGDIELFGDDGGGDIELFGDDGGGGNVELFGDEEDDGVELFADDGMDISDDRARAEGEGGEKKKTADADTTQEDLGDNVELF